MSFVELVRLSREEGLTLAELAARTGCTKGCGLCEPYVRLALVSGKSAFPVMHPLTVERMIAEANSKAAEENSKAAKQQSSK